MDWLVGFPCPCRLRPRASRLRLPGELLKPMLDNDEPVRRTRLEPANHQEPFVVETDGVLRRVLERLEPGRGKKSGSPSHREARRRRQRYCSEVSDFVTIEKLVPLVRPLRLRPSSRRYRPLRGSSVRKGYDVDLESTGFVRGVGKPASIR